MAGSELVMRVPRHDFARSIPAGDIVSETPIFAIGCWRPRGYFGGRAGTLLAYPSGIAWFPASFLRGYGFTVDALALGAEMVGLGMGDVGHRILHEVARRRRAAISDAEHVRRGMSRHRSVAIALADIVEMSCTRQRRLALTLVDATGARRSDMFSNSRPIMAAIGERIAILRFVSELRAIDPALVAGDATALGSAVHRMAKEASPEARRAIAQLLTDYAGCAPVAAAFPGVFAA